MKVHEAGILTMFPMSIPVFRYVWYKTEIISRVTVGAGIAVVITAPNTFYSAYTAVWGFRLLRSRWNRLTVFIKVNPVITQEFKFPIEKSRFMNPIKSSHLSWNLARHTGQSKWDTSIKYCNNIRFPTGTDPELFLTAENGWTRLYFTAAISTLY